MRQRLFPREKTPKNYYQCNYCGQRFENKEDLLIWGIYPCCNICFDKKLNPEEAKNLPSASLYVKKKSSSRQVFNRHFVLGDINTNNDKGGEKHEHTTDKH